MSSLLPLASYNLELQPFSPEPCQPEDFPVTVRLTLAAVNPEPFDDKEEPSTLRILKKSINLDDYDSDEEDFDDEDDSEQESEEESENEGKIQEINEKDEEDEDKAENENDHSDEESGESSSSESENDDLEDDDAIEEHIICTLSPKSQFQQILDLTILPDEEVYFVVTGSYSIHLTGNYVEHPYDEEEDEYSDDDSEDDEDSDSDEYDLTPDEDEIIEEDFDLDDLEGVDDIEGKIEELVEEDQKAGKGEKKRPAEEEPKEVKESKKSKKDLKKESKEAKEAKKDKSVKFNKDLEQGPTGPAAKQSSKSEDKKKFPTKTLQGGVTIEDRTVGTGPVCKKGQKVGVRYIGKLKNGKVFDKNTSGKPFVFALGKGEVIKGWDLGVAGMAVGGERRIVIPPAMAYGSKKLPGIPANSELTFDVKLLSIK
ncbi:hypothetical protein KL921_002815 [Ogataea angusta]|uniref:FK506-binding protein n=1 Tax=Pichia angusta TaxID=870730 RepID=A0AAN6I5E0_PICAN|nr:uncharacterized protein KL928_003051 [Ogataea angusta]KAG7810320.1 hypothetical protein KL921_002815 [Ogataea angusta]KAG7818050.1 hypothetical protein KL928_003051 [Ogataea angusta]KAG7824501.1 hypothetical protein KL909_001723 [Ogataea angusta]KAG7834242.1 hypothetical protein KL943_003538 [Ogataea angusta]KAG7839871.1 hypothetical protein KL942_002670 [Ogataea angusta]